MTKSNHKVPVVRITELLPHPNADSLSIVRIGGYQCVVKTDHWKVGDLGVYIQPDSIVPQSKPFEFLWADKEFLDGVVPEKYRHVKARRFRKEWSEGLLLPASDFFFDSSEVGGKQYGLKEGEDVSELLGVTHYEPPEPIDMYGVVRKQQYKWPPKSLKGWFYYLLHLIGIDLNGPGGGSNEKGPKNPPPVYDVEAYKNFLGSFEPSEPVIVTEKIHGSNARFMFDGKKMYVGSRKLWKSERSSCVWRKCLAQHPWIETWCRMYPNHTLYGEVAPTQGGFSYGTENGQVKFFAFDVLGPDGEFIAWNDLSQFNCPQGNVIMDAWVPVLYEGPFDEERIKKFVDGPSLVNGTKHIREGVVVRPITERLVHGLGRLQLKIVSNAFLEKF
jgi:hypothetical protein